MFKVKKLTWAIGCALVLNGCAFPFQSKVASVNDIEVRPVERINHAGYQPKIMYLLGRYYQGKIQYGKAIEAYHKAIALNPSYVEVHNGLAVIYAIQGNFDLSFQHFSKALKIEPRSSYLHNNLGYAYLIQGNEYEAAEAFKMALQIDPKNEQARTNLVTASNRIGVSVEELMAIALSESTVDNSASVTAVQFNSNEDTKASELVQVASNVYEFNKLESTIATPVEEQLNIDPVMIAMSVEKQDSKVQRFTEMRIEVSNGNGVGGMARQVSHFLEHYGAEGVRLTNHQTFYYPETEIYFRSGNAQHANQLNQVLPKPVRMIESDDLRSDIQVKILLGSDFSKEMAFFDQKNRIQVSALTD